MTARALIEQARKLPVSQRLRLVDQVWETIPEDERARVLTNEEKKELDRRWREHQKHPERAPSWEDVKARLQGRLKKG
jgi:putative addiction module component (TIGR02574 family)